MGFFPSFGKIGRKKLKRAPPNHKSLIFVQHFIAGGLGGGLSRTLTAPFDRARIFYQVSTRTLHLHHVFKYMINEGGVVSLWRGNMINIIKTVPKTAWRFAFYDTIKRFVKQQNPNGQSDLNLQEKFLAGAIAGMLGQTLTYPLEVLKVRMSLRKTGQFKGVVDAVRKILKWEGPKAFWSGFLPNLVAVVPYSGLDLAGYDFSKKYFTEMKGSKLNNKELFAVGSLAVLVAQVTTYPLVVVFTRLQASPEDFQQKRNAVMMLVDVWKNEGFTGFYRGLVPNLIKFIPAVAFSYVIYEQVMAVLNKMEIFNPKTD